MKQEREDWVRMASYLHATVPIRPDLEPLRAAGHRITIHASTAAVCIPLYPWRDRGGWQEHAKIERPEWWVPARRSHGDRLADELAARALEIFHAREGSRG